MAHHIDQLKHIIDYSKSIVCCTGAGVSVSDGFPAFCAKGGVSDALSKECYSPEYLLSTNECEDYHFGC
ncbi:hypothetical protein DV965_16850 [Staphylococcus pseudintermedius]|uniref:hypothetical protein n=1 Tax=Staphylococcus pseudintermedius TaxID=283734 RepID=UPI000E3B4280|nr:hypothetical protein [Staphylococcus pseudintermedius]REB90442.1 hypothetical protein DV965_16850 [Staphylococcus pseudintermedius]